MVGLIINKKVINHAAEHPEHEQEVLSSSHWKTELTKVCSFDKLVVSLVLLFAIFI